MAFVGRSYDYESGFSYTICDKGVPIWKELKIEEGVYWHPVEMPKVPHLKGLWDEPKRNLIFLTRKEAEAFASNYPEELETVNKIETIWS